MILHGLTYLPQFLNLQEEETLLEFIKEQNWCYDLKRRTQHYGYKYSYKDRKVGPDSYLGELPQEFNWLIDKIQNINLLNSKPNQIIINEYCSGQGISPHVDCIPCFENQIISLSLLSDCEMQFSSVKNNNFESLTLERRSLLFLQNEARYEWKHGIRKCDERRISITLRKIRA